MSNNRQMMNQPSSSTTSSSSRPLGMSRGIKTFPGNSQKTVDSHDNKPSHRTRRHSFSAFLEPFELNRRSSTSRRKISFMLPSDDFRLSDKIDEANEIIIGNEKSKACPSLSEVVASEKDNIISSSKSPSQPRRLTPLKSTILLSYLVAQSFLPQKKKKEEKVKQSTAEEDLTEYRNLQSISNVDLHEQNISATRSISGNSSPRSDFPLSLRFSRSKRKTKEYSTQVSATTTTTSGGVGGSSSSSSFPIGISAGSDSSPMINSRGLRKITSANVLSDMEKERDRVRVGVVVTELKHDGHEQQQSIVCRECNRECNRDLNALAPVSY